MPIHKLKVKIQDNRFVLPEFGDDFTGFSAGEEIRPKQDCAVVYIAGKKNVLDAVTAEAGLARSDVSAQAETLHMKEAKDKAEKVKEITEGKVEK